MNTIATSLKRNSDDPAWEHVECRDPNNKNSIYCKLCRKTFSGGITRAKEHLMHKKGNVTSCPEVTAEIMKQINDYVTNFHKKKYEKKRVISLVEGHERFLDREVSEEEEELQILGDEGVKGRSSMTRTTSGSGKKRKTASLQRGPMDAMFPPNHDKMKQTQIEHRNPFKEKEKQEAWRAIAEWAFEVGLPFNAVRAPSFQTMIYAIGKYGPGMH